MTGDDEVMSKATHIRETTFTKGTNEKEFINEVQKPQK